MSIYEQEVCDDEEIWDLIAAGYTEFKKITLKGLGLSRLPNMSKCTITEIVELKKKHSSQFGRNPGE